MLDATQPMPEEQTSIAGGNMGQEQPVPEQGQQHIMAGQNRDYKANPLNDEDRDEFDKISVQATKLLHAPETRDKVLGRIAGKAHPYKDIADTAVAVMSMIDGQSVKEGKPNDKAVRMLGYLDITKQIVDLAVAAGKLKEKPPENDMKAIIARVVQKDQSNVLSSGGVKKEVMQEELQKATSGALEASGGSVVEANNKAITGRNMQKKAAAKTQGSMKQQLNGELTMTEQLSGGLLDG